MNKNLTEIIFILDKSGSMFGLEKDTIGGFNSMLKTQKQNDKEALVTTVLFNSKTNFLHDRIDIKEVEELTEKDYSPYGSTALLDAIGSTIEHISKVHIYIREEDRPSKTIVIITTDGMENSSKLYTYPEISNLINKKKKENWEFLFLGANIDAIGTAHEMGIEEDKAVNYHCDKKGLKVCYGAIAGAICNIRGNQEIDESWKEIIEKDFNERKEN